jgi:hypothetical protein
MAGIENWNQKLSTQCRRGIGRAGIKTFEGETEMELQGISLRAGKSESTIQFEVTNDLGGRCVGKLNKYIDSQEGTITLSASATGESDKRELCRQLIKLIMADANIREHDRTELCNFLACQSLKAKRSILLGR